MVVVVAEAVVKVAVAMVVAVVVAADVAVVVAVVAVAVAVAGAVVVAVAVVVVAVVETAVVGLVGKLQGWAQRDRQCMLQSPLHNGCRLTVLQTIPCSGPLNTVTGTAQPATRGWRRVVLARVVC